MAAREVIAGVGAGCVTLTGIIVAVSWPDTPGLFFPISILAGLGVILLAIPDTPEDDAHSLAHGDSFPVFPASHDDRSAL